MNVVAIGVDFDDRYIYSHDFLGIAMRQEVK